MKIVNSKGKLKKKTIMIYLIVENFGNLAVEEHNWWSLGHGIF